MGNRSNPKRLRHPKLSNALIVDSYRGQARVRSWPRKTGKPRSPAVRQQNDWLRASAFMWKVIPASQQKAAAEYAKGTGLYPRDVFTMALSGSLFDLQFEDGSTLLFRRQYVEKKVFQGCILRLTANQSMTQGVANFISWPTPILDTSGWYNPANPDRLTVPGSVAVASFNLGVLITGAASGDRMSVEVYQNGTQIAVQWVDVSNAGAVQCHTGPVLVNEGDVINFSANPIGFSGDAIPPYTFASATLEGTDF